MEVLTISEQLLNIGFGNFVSLRRVIFIADPSSSPLKKIVSVAQERNILFDATYGRKTRSIVVTDNGIVFLSTIKPETASNRIIGGEE